MKRLISTLVFCLWICTVSAQTTVTYVGNAGFMIQLGEKKILIDALFKGFEGDYIMPQNIQEKLTKAQAPFNDVDLILVTHAHGDHIDLDMVREHMRNNPDAIFASTKQLVDHMSDFSDRSYGFKPLKGESDTKDICGFNIETFLFPHGPDSQITNIAFLVSINGVTFFHTGDVDLDQFTFQEFRALQLPEKDIDLAFIPHFYLTGDPSIRQFVAQGIGGKKIIPIHYHFTTPPFNAEIVQHNYPYAKIFTKELQSWIVPTGNKRFPILKGQYLGQPPPSDSAIVFAPGIISTDSTIEHGSPTFSPDGYEVFWQANYRRPGKKTQIFGRTMRYVDGTWTAPEESSFSSCQMFAPDGERLYFLPVEEDNREKEGPQYVCKNEDQWQKPVSMGLLAKFPELKYAYNYSVTRDGTFYFIANAHNLGTMNGFGIYRMELNNGKYKKPELLPSCINAGDGVLNWTPFIAPDESYLLFCSDRNGSSQDIYISFRNTEGQWTEAQNLGPTVNTDKGERFPSISPDGKYLFFTRWVYSGNEDVMWINAGIIKKIKQKSLLALL